MIIIYDMIMINKYNKYDCIYQAFNIVSYYIIYLLIYILYIYI